MGEAPGSAQPLLHGLLCPGEILMSLLLQTGHGRVSEAAAPAEVHHQHSRTGPAAGPASTGGGAVGPGEPHRGSPGDEMHLPEL